MPACLLTCIRASHHGSVWVRGVCLCVSVSVYGIHTRHRPLYTPSHTAYSPPYGPHSALVARLTNLLRERSRCSLIFRFVRAAGRRRRRGDITRLERGPGQRSTGTKRSPDGGEQRGWLLPSLPRERNRQSGLGCPVDYGARHALNTEPGLIKPTTGSIVIDPSGIWLRGSDRIVARGLIHEIGRRSTLTSGREERANSSQEEQEEGGPRRQEAVFIEVWCVLLDSFHSRKNTRCVYRGLEERERTDRYPSTWSVPRGVGRRSFLVNPEYRYH